MKKIVITVFFFAMLIVIACDTAKNGTAVATAPAPVAPNKTDKSVMKESNMKTTPTSATAEKKVVSKKAEMQLSESSVITLDSVVPKR
jgi:hypothetical protein